MVDQTSLIEECFFIKKHHEDELFGTSATGQKFVIALGVFSLSMIELDSSDFILHLGD